jgi:hypothetical protein
MRCPLAITGLVVLALLTLTDHPALAEHEIYYRYTVLGYVTDANGRALAATTVELVREKTGLAYRVRTDERGLYLLVARLGDESIGESLVLASGPTRTRLTVRFDADNHRDERGTRVDLEGARWTERPASFRSTLPLVLTPPAR